MTPQDRKAVLRDWKDRKGDAGIFALRCADGQVWVGPTPTLAAMRNRLWFTLGQGGAPNPAMQAAWAAHGAEGFGFEVLERVNADSPLALKDRLAERATFWRDRLSALAA